MGKQTKSAVDADVKELSTRFSFFTHGYLRKDNKLAMQVKPQGSMSIEEVYRYITDPTKARHATETLRTITDKESNSRYKLLNFEFVTFSCLCSYRNKEGVEALTPFVVLDYDGKDLRQVFPNQDIKEVLEWMRQEIWGESNFDKPLMFTSPNGDGLKAVVYVADKQGLSHRDCFTALSAYFEHLIGVKADASGSDVTRPCYLPYDEDPYVSDHLHDLRAPRINMAAWLPKRDTRNVGRVYANPPYEGSAQDVFQLVERWASQQVAYAVGSRNNYIMRCIYSLCSFGVPESEAEAWALARFSDYDAASIRSTVHSCYRNGSFGVREFHSR